MNLGLSKIIAEIEHEIETQYLGGAIAWADEQYANGFSQAIDRFDNALLEFIKNKNESFIRSEGAIYKQRCLSYIREYKKAKNFDEVQNTLRSIDALLENRTD